MNNTEQSIKGEETKLRLKRYIKKRNITWLFFVLHAQEK